MKKALTAALLLALAASPALAADTDTVAPIDTAITVDHAPHPFNVRDLVMMQRVSDPQLSPDGRYAAFGVRSTDYAANKGVNAIEVLDLSRGGEPVTVVAKGASAPRWAPDGKSLYYVAPADGVAQLWRLDFAAGKGGLDLAGHAAPVQVSHGVLDIQDYKLSPDGKSVLLSYAVFTDCGTLACTKQMQDKRAADKATGTLYKKLFVRHWDTWSDGTRNQLYLGRFDTHG